jgi:hypothetical protein
MIKESSRGGELNMIYLIHCENFCKYSSVPPPSTTIIIKKKHKVKNSEVSMHKNKSSA